MKQTKQMSCGEAGRYMAAGNPGKKMCCRKVLLLIVALLSVELVNLTLWQLNVIPSTPSLFISEILTCATSFFAGRIYEKLSK